MTHSESLAAIAPAQYDKLVPALLAVCDECGYVQKASDHPQFKFASDADIIAAIRPSLIKNGLVIFPTTSECHTQHHADAKSGTPMFRADLIQGFRIIHKSGQYMDMQTAGCGTDAQDKAVYKAMTGARKYLLRLLIGFATGDDAEYTSPADKDAANTEAREKLSQEHYDRLVTMILDGEWPQDVRIAANEMEQIRGQLTDEHYEALKTLGAQRKKKERTDAD